jgi:hypothetical protein
MPRDLASQLLLKSLGSTAGEHPCCSRCQRSPLPGELLHVFDRGKKLCALCVAQLPESEREPLRSERVHVSKRSLAVLPRAA